LIGLARHDVIRLPAIEGGRDGNLFAFYVGAPSATLIAFSLIGVFIAQSLITAAEADRKSLASYPTYFDAAWKLELQIVLAVVFVGLFWLLLWLGAALLALIKIEFLRRLIGHAWFSMPVTTLALSAAIHLTDVRASIISGMRSLVHIVLSWLLPMIAVIVGIFLVSLPVTGLDPLWRTSHAGALLLTVAAVLIVLINAIYRDGTAEQAAPRVLRICGSLACVELVPIVGIAALAVGLRVGQHGWSVDRVFAAAATIVAAFYAVGYIVALVRRGPWLRGLERWNVLASFVILGTMLALLTPIGDPARVAVSSQVALLKSGRIAPDQFDYGYLRWHGERYGREALETLAFSEGSDAAIRTGADRALHATNMWDNKSIAPPTSAELAAAITVYPAGRSLPDTFLQQKWPTDQQWNRPPCLSNKTARCDAFLVDLDGDGREEVVLSDAARAVVFKIDDTGVWRTVGQLSTNLTCASVRDAMHAGQVTTQPSSWKELNIAGRTFRIVPSLLESSNCH